MALAFALGCGAGTRIAGNRQLAVGVVAVGVAAAVAAAAHRRATLPAAMLGFAAAGLASGSLAARPSGLEGLAAEPAGLAGPWRVRGRLKTDPEPSAGGARLDVDVEAVRIDGVWLATDGAVRIWVAESVDPVWRRGRGFEALLSLRPDRSNANPGLPPVPWLKTAGLDLRASLKSFRQLRPRGGRAALGSGLRASLRRRIEARFGPRAPVVRALLLGERADLDPALTVSLEHAGLVHLLAISGLHVGLWFALVWTLGRLFALPQPLCTALALGAVLTLGALVVPRPAVERATTMAMILAASSLTGRRAEALAALALAVLLLGAADPWVARNGGFQLSVAATAAILLLTGWLEARLRRLPGPLRRSLAVTAAAQLGVAPLLAASVYRVPLGGLLGNLAGVPLLAVILVCSSLALLLDVVGAAAAAAALAGVTDLALSVLAGLAARLTALPGNAVIVPAGRAWLLWALPIGVGLAARCRHRAGAAFGLALAAGVVPLALWPVAPPPWPVVHVLDVGQGDAIVVRTPRDGAFVIDTGGTATGSFDTGRGIVAPVLRGFGITRLEALGLSHLHVDHAGGAAGLLDELPVGAVWTGSFAPDSAAARALTAAAAAVPLVSLSGGHERPGRSCSWESLHPVGRWLRPGGTPIENDASLVLALHCGGRTLLLSGDSEAPAEADWAARLSVTASTVLKVPHHGSRTSSSELLLDAAAPRHAIISAGWRNRFGFPHADVLERYRRRGIALYRTDRDGALTLTMGRRVTIRGERWVAG